MALQTKCLHSFCQDGPIGSQSQIDEAFKDAWTHTKKENTENKPVCHMSSAQYITDRVCGWCIV